MKLKMDAAQPPLPKTNLRATFHISLEGIKKK